MRVKDFEMAEQVKFEEAMRQLGAALGRAIGIRLLVDTSMLLVERESGDFVRVRLNAGKQFDMRLVDITPEMMLYAVNPLRTVLRHIERAMVVAGADKSLARSWYNGLEE